MQYLILTKENKEIDWSKEEKLLIEEAKMIWKDITSTRIRNIWFTKGKNDAILLIEEEDESSVKVLLDALPLVKAKLINYKIIALTAYTGFERLFQEKR